MNVDEIIAELRALGSASTKRVLIKHGAQEPFFGVKIELLKKIQKRIKKDHALALALYDTGISDAMYLAGLIADDERMTKRDLQRWAKQAYWYMLSDYTVAWVAAGSRHGWEVALDWIDSKNERIASAGWCTLSSLAATKDDAELDLPALRRLLKRVEKTIHQAPNHVRGAMNGFVIAVGCFVRPLTEDARRVARSVGVVQVEMGETACQVPSAADCIAKVEARGALGKKRKSAKC